VSGDLDLHYAEAERMLGVVTHPRRSPIGEVLSGVAEDLEVGHTFRPTRVGTVSDPFFGGAGPTRTGRIECGQCMIGCRTNAKNTLPKKLVHATRPGRAAIAVHRTPPASRSPTEDVAGPMDTAGDLYQR